MTSLFDRIRAALCAALCPSRAVPQQEPDPGPDEFGEHDEHA
jgi:hypothetical protein